MTRPPRILTARVSKPKRLDMKSLERLLVGRVASLDYRMGVLSMAVRGFSFLGDFGGALLVDQPGPILIVSRGHSLPSSARRYSGRRRLRRSPLRRRPLPLPRPPPFPRLPPQAAK